MDSQPCTDREPCSHGLQNWRDHVKKDLVEWLSGGRKKYQISPFAEDQHIDFPEPAIIGKIVSFRLEDTKDLVWTVEQTEETPEVIETMKSIVEFGEGERKAGNPVEFGRTRNINGRESGTNKFQVDYEVGSKRLNYALETDRGFWKIAFVVDEDSILAIDLYK